MSGAIILLPHTPLWRGQEQPCFLSYTIDKMKYIAPENSTNLSASVGTIRSNCRRPFKILLLLITKTTVWNEITCVIGKFTINEAEKTIFYSRPLFTTYSSYKSKICVYQIKHNCILLIRF
jgi:hypothetical protein